MKTREEILNDFEYVLNSLNVGKKLKFTSVQLNKKKISHYSQIYPSLIDAGYVCKDTRTVLKEPPSSKELYDLITHRRKLLDKAQLQNNSPLERMSTYDFDNDKDETIVYFVQKSLKELKHRGVNLTFETKKDKPKEFKIEY